MSQAYGRKVSRALARVEAALEEIEELGGKLGCRICWMFEGAGRAQHQWVACTEVDGDCLSFRDYMDFQRKINYRKDQQARFLSCFYCHLSQALCPDGYQDRGASCRWKHVVIPLAYAATTEQELWAKVQELAGREIKGPDDYAGWLGRKHRKLVYGREITNAMAVFQLILEWRIEAGY